MRSNKARWLVHYLVVTALGILTSSFVVWAATPIEQFSSGKILNAAELNNLVDELNAPTAKSIPDTILCKKSGTQPPGGGNFSLSFANGDCRVDLGSGTYQDIMPDSHYHGVASQLNFCSGMVNFTVKQPSASVTPGIDIFQYIGADTAGCNTYDVAVLFIKIT